MYCFCSFVVLFSLVLTYKAKKPIKTNPILPNNIIILSIPIVFLLQIFKKRGYTVPENLKDNITHLSFKQVAQYFKTTFSIDDSVEAIMDEWHEMAYNEYSNNVFLKEGAMEYLHSLKKAGIKAIIRSYIKKQWNL